MNVARISIEVTPYQADLRSRVSGEGPLACWRVERQNMAWFVVSASSSHHGQRPGSGQFGRPRR